MVFETTLKNEMIKILKQEKEISAYKITLKILKIKKAGDNEKFYSKYSNVSRFMKIFEQDRQIRFVREVVNDVGSKERLYRWVGE